MPNLEANGIRLEYDTFGDPAGRPLVLIMGLGQQMILWHEDFCRQLAEHGHYVIRFDNRDVGRSTTFENAGSPSVFGTALRFWTTRSLEPAYTLEDMADDVAGLLDGLAIERAHLAGASMGGIIAQVFAGRYPARTLSLTSMMANSGNPRLPLPTLRAMWVALRTPPADRDGYVDYAVRLWRTVGSPGYPFREQLVRERSIRAWERGPCPSGLARQLVAVAAAGDRRRELAAITAPTLVVHGEEDPLIPVEGGRETARIIPDARLLAIAGMGHDLPFEIWPRVIGALAEHTRHAESAAWTPEGR